MCWHMSAALSQHQLLGFEIVQSFVCSMLLWLNGVIFCVFIIHSSVDGQLGYFHVLTIVSSAAMSFDVHVSFQRFCPYDFLQIYAQNGIAGSYKSSICSFFYFFGGNFIV